MPFKEFISRQGWQGAAWVLGFIFLYKLGDSMATALATPFYLDTGFSKTEIGLVAKHAGLWPAVIGGLLGGAWMLKLGINRALWVFGVVQCVSILGFVLLDQVGPDLRVLALAIGFEALGVGLGTAAFIAFIARITHPAACWAGRGCSSWASTARCGCLAWCNACRFWALCCWTR
jgi:PAT family beta-lactamase induction signal transducer AmpG